MTIMLAFLAPKLFRAAVEAACLTVEPEVESFR
jgi:hypothetical protein